MSRPILEHTQAISSDPASTARVLLLCCTHACRASQEANRCLYTRASAQRDISLAVWLSVCCIYGFERKSNLTRDFTWMVRTRGTCQCAPIRGFDVASITALAQAQEALLLVLDHNILISYQQVLVFGSQLCAQTKQQQDFRDFPRAWCDPRP